MSYVLLKSSKLKILVLTSGPIFLDLPYIPVDNLHKLLLRPVSFYLPFSLLLENKLLLTELMYLLLLHCLQYLHILAGILFG